MSTESLPFDEEAASTGIGSGNGSAEAAEAAQAPVAGTNTQVANSLEEEIGGDYNERLRSGGEFAEQEVKSWERKFSKANSERDAIKQQLDGLGKLLPIVEQLGGEQNVIQSLTRFGNLLSDTRLKQMIESYEATGTLSASQEEGDEYVDPLEAELRKENRDLAMRISRLEGNTLRQDGTLVKQRITGYFQKSLGAHPFTEEQAQKIRDGIERHINEWSKNEQGIRALENLDEANVESLVRTQLSHDDWRDVYRREDESRREEKRGLATDAPARTATHQAHSAAKTVLDACKDAFKQEGLDPRERLI